MFQISILNDIARGLNFTYKVHAPSDGGLWGQVLANGSGTGLLRDIQVDITYLLINTYKDDINTRWICFLNFQTGIADIGIADFYIVPKRSAILDHLYPHSNDKVCFLVLKPPLNPKWKDLLSPFHLEVWIAISIALLTCTIFLILVSYFTPFGQLHCEDVPMFVISLFFDESHSFTQQIQ